MGLRDKYQHAIAVCKGMFQGNAEERDGKLYFKGSVKWEEEKNKIWDAIKTVPDWRNDIVADIQVTGGKTYTVKAGDTLSKIAKETLGSANDYMKIFDMNKDQLKNPDQIKPGQVLKLP